MVGKSLITTTGLCVLILSAFCGVSHAENPVDVLMNAATNLLALMSDVMGVLELSGSEGEGEFDWERAIETTRDYLLAQMESDEDGPVKERLLELGEDLKIVPDYAVDVAVRMAEIFKEDRDEDALDLVKNMLGHSAEGEGSKDYDDDSEDSGMNVKGHWAPPDLRPGK